MKTYVAEGVLTDYTSGMIVVKAKNKKVAIELVMNATPHDFIMDCGRDACYDEDCLTHKLRELKDNEVAYVYGGG